MKNNEKSIEEPVVSDLESPESEEVLSDEVVVGQSEDSSDQDGENSISDEGLDWYIVQCYSGQEYKVQLRIEQMVEEKKWEKKIVRVLVPEEDTIEIKETKRVERRVKVYPGYVFLQMANDVSVFFDIRKLPGVSKFIGPKNNPTPVTEQDILKVLRKMGDKTKKVDVQFSVGEVIKIIAGPFRGYSGPIADINNERGKVKAMILIFGRETPVELEFDQVETVIK
nr:transcription termination/antitermination factor NusG [Candidatus Marinamargulisbacteria bacterium SCGC AG-410-N11]